MYPTMIYKVIIFVQPYFSANCAWYQDIALSNKKEKNVKYFVTLVFIAMYKLHNGI